MLRQVHNLKIQSMFFRMSSEGRKDWEIRKDDRGYRIGDFIVLNEVTDVCKKPTKRHLNYKIVSIVSGEVYGIKKGYVILSLVRA